MVALLYVAAVALALPAEGAAPHLRSTSRGGQILDSWSGQGAKAGKNKKCDTHGAKWALGLLEKSHALANRSEAEAVYFDGYSRYGCEKDISPKAQRVYLMDKVCSKVPSCRALEKAKNGMTPRMCFDFCRAQESAKFFGIEFGRDCYCTGFVHAHSTGGGDCDLPCMGDNEEMCGGKTKSSVFEMHMCGDSADEATEASEAAQKAEEEFDAVHGTGVETVEKLRALANSWQLGVCSVKPHGERLCSYSSGWQDQAGALQKDLADSAHTLDVLAKRGEELGASLQAVEDAGEQVTAKEASALEQATAALNAAAAKATSATAVARLALNRPAGGLAKGKALGGFDKVFQEQGDRKNGWNGLCTLKPMKGQRWAKLTADDPAVCGNACLEVASGVDGCVGFNYQYKDGLTSCQFMTREGVVKPDISLNDAVPIFEVSDSKKDDMGIETLGCWVNQAFLAGHPKGPLKYEVIREITK